jgi:hypothetical protein
MISRLIPVKAIQVAGDEGRKTGSSANCRFKTPCYSGAINSRRHHLALGVKQDMVKSGGELGEFHGSEGICLGVCLSIKRQVGMSKLQVLVTIDMLENGKVWKPVHKIEHGNDSIPF